MELAKFSAFLRFKAGNRRRNNGTISSAKFLSRIDCHEFRALQGRSRESYSASIVSGVLLTQL